MKCRRCKGGPVVVLDTDDGSTEFDARRRRECPVCRRRWSTMEREIPGTETLLPGVNGPITGGWRPPPMGAQPPANGGSVSGGVGGGLPSALSLSLVPEVPSYSQSNPDQSQTRACRKRRANIETSPEFATFWARWPRKVSKDDAIKAWDEMVGSDVAIIALIHDTLDWFVPELLEREPKNRPHAASWLHKRRWLDEEPAPAKAALPAKVQQSRGAAMEWFAKGPR